MHAEKFLATLGAPLVGVTVTAVLWLTAPASVALVVSVATGSALTLLLVASFGDRRFAPVAGLSTFIGTGVATFVAEFPREGSVEWILVGFGGVGLCCFLVRVRLGNLRRAATTPVDPSRRRRLLGRGADALLAVQTRIQRLLPTTTHVLLAGALVGAASLGVHAYGLVYGSAVLASGGLVLVFAVTFLPFYVATDWRALDGLAVDDAAERSGLPPGVLERIRRGIGHTTAESTGIATDLRESTPSPLGTAGGSGPDGSPSGSATVPSTPDLAAADWLPSLRDLAGAVSHQARTLAGHGRTVVRLLGATTAASARSFAVAAAGFARSASDPDAETEKSADGPGSGPTLDAVTSTDPDVEAAPKEGTVVEPEPIAGPAMKPAPTAISPEDPAFSADGRADRRDPDVSAAAKVRPGAQGSAAFDGAAEHLPGPDASGRGDDTVSRRVAEVLYGDDEASEEDPGPGDDDWIDRLESPEV